jgi:hypothetical protein
VLFGTLEFLSFRQATMFLSYDKLFKGIDLIASIVLTPLPLAAIAISSYAIVMQLILSNGQLECMFKIASLLLFTGATLAFVLFFSSTY